MGNAAKMMIHALIMCGVIVGSFIRTLTCILMMCTPIEVPLILMEYLDKGGQRVKGDFKLTSDLIGH